MMQQNQSPKSNIAICLIVKNEAPYLLEWIAYHRVIGVERFLIYNNDSTDETSTILEHLDKAGIVTYIEWPSKPETLSQLEAYRDAWRRLVGQCEWVAFIDADEFLVPIQHHDLPSFLSEYVDVAGIAINWKLFGSSGHLFQSEGLVMERFTKSSKSNAPQNAHFKTIARINCVKNVNIHRCKFSDRDIYCYPDRLPVTHSSLEPISHINHDFIQINHYFTKSKAEWSLKRARGRAPNSLSKPLKKIRTESFFDRNDLNEEEDSNILRFVDKTKQEIKYLKKVSHLDESDFRLKSKFDRLQVIQVNSLFKDSQNQLLGGVINFPRSNTEIEPISVKISGWVIGKKSSAITVQIICSGKILLEVPVSQARPKIAERYPKNDSAQNCGFSGSISLIGMPTQSDILVQAVLDDKSCPLIGLIQYCAIGEVSRGETIIVEEPIQNEENNLKNIEFNLISSKWKDSLQTSPVRLYTGNLTHRAQQDGWIGISKVKSDESHIPHNWRKLLPIPDESVDAFLCEEFLKLIPPHQLLSVVFPELYRTLKPGGYIRMALPDYRCDVYLNRDLKDEKGNPYCDPEGGGKWDAEQQKITQGGLAWFPTYETLKALIELSPLRYCRAKWLHYYDANGEAVMNEIDYSKGFIKRTPDNDNRVKNTRRPMSIVVDLYKD